MRRRRAEIESEIPVRGIDAPPLPRIRRQLERICEAINVDYDDLAELYIEPGVIRATVYQRNSEGARFRNEGGRIAIDIKTIQVDTATFVGDERDF